MRNIEPERLVFRVTLIVVVAVATITIAYHEGQKHPTQEGCSVGLVGSPTCPSGCEALMCPVPKDWYDTIR